MVYLVRAKCISMQSFLVEATDAAEAEQLFNDGAAEFISNSEDIIDYEISRISAAPHLHSNDNDK